MINSHTELSPWNEKISVVTPDGLGSPTFLRWLALLVHELNQVTTKLAALNKLTHSNEVTSWDG